MSRFKGILDQAKHRDPEPVAASPPPSPALPPLSPAPPPTAPEPRIPGRPPGKRSDPGFVQVTAYVSAELHHNVKLALLMERKGREFSELVGELLAEWLKTNH